MVLELIFFVIWRLSDELTGIEDKMEGIDIH